MAFEKIFLENNAGQAFVEALNPHLQMITRDRINKAKEDREFTRKAALATIENKLTPLELLKLQADAVRYQKTIDDAVERGDDRDDQEGLVDSTFAYNAYFGGKTTQKSLDAAFKQTFIHLNKTVDGYNLPKNKQEAIKIHAAAYKSASEKIAEDTKRLEKFTFTSVKRRDSKEKTRSKLARKTISNWQGAEGDNAIDLYKNGLITLYKNPAWIPPKLLTKMDLIFSKKIKNTKDENSRNLHIAIAAMRNGMSFDSALAGKALGLKLTTDNQAQLLKAFNLQKSAVFKSMTEGQKKEALNEAMGTGTKIDSEIVDFYSLMLDAEGDPNDPEHTSRTLGFQIGKLNKAIDDARETITDKLDPNTKPSVTATGQLKTALQDLPVLGRVEAGNAFANSALNSKESLSNPAIIGNAMDRIDTVISTLDPVRDRQHITALKIQREKLDTMGFIADSLGGFDRKAPTAAQRKDKAAVVKRSNVQAATTQALGNFRNKTKAFKQDKITNSLKDLFNKSAVGGVTADVSSLKEVKILGLDTSGGRISVRAKGEGKDNVTELTISSFEQAMENFKELKAVVKSTTGRELTVKDIRRIFKDQLKIESDNAIDTGVLK